MTSKYTPLMIQEALLDAGYDLGPYGADGVWGKDSAKALALFQLNNRLAVTGTASLETLQHLFPDDFKPRKAKMNWFSSLVGTTAFKYLVTIAATWLAARLGVDQGSIEGLITQAIALAMGVWGVVESARPKAVTKDGVVPLAKLPETEKMAVEDIVAANRK